MPPTVHLTSHSCLVATPEAHPMFDFQVELRDRLKAKAIEYPIDRVCRLTDRRSRSLSARRHHYSTFFDEVTCERCRASADRRTAERDRPGTPIKSECDWRRTVLATHGACCRNVGAPVALSPEDLDAVSRADRSEHVHKLLARFREPMAMVATGIEDGEALGVHAYRSGLSKAVAKLADEEPAIRCAIQPALDQLTLAGDLLEEVTRMFERASELTAKVAELQVGAA